MTSILTNTRRPDISVNAAGRIDITARVARSLAMEPGDVIDIAAEGREYYLYVRHKASNLRGRHVGQCFPTSRIGRGGSYRTWSVQLAAAIRSAAGTGELSLRLPCGEAVVINDKVYVPIIMKCAL